MASMIQMYTHISLIECSNLILHVTMNVHIYNIQEKSNFYKMFAVIQILTVTSAVSFPSKNLNMSIADSIGNSLSSQLKMVKTANRMVILVKLGVPSINTSFNGRDVT